MTNYQPYNKKPYVDQIKGKRNWTDANLLYHRMDIAEYLFQINNKKCFYCKNVIDRDISVEHIEHIVDKKDYNQFAYNTKNLTISCPLCNTKKSTQNVLNLNLPRSCSHNNYPYNSQNYSIVHAYLDDYESCISRINNIIYIGIDEHEKGYNTIKMCGINEVIRLESRIKKIESKKQSITNIIETIKNVEQAKDEMTKLVNKIFDRESIENNLGTLSEEDGSIEYLNGESKKLNDFINKLKKDNTLLRNNTIDEICKVDSSKFENIKKIYNLCEFKLEGTELELLNIDEENNYSIENINDSIKVLNIINLLFRQKDYRNVMPFLINIDEYDDITRFYEEIHNNHPDDLYAKLFLSVRWIIEVCRLYIYNLETKLIKEGHIDDMIRVCEELKGMFETA